MGLYAEISTADWPEEITNDEFGITVLVDYSMAIQGFINTFMEVATSLCPVDTGYLCSTIDAGGDESSVYAEATAEYAAYVEYGTSRMGAQPFFEPALEAAVEVLSSMAQIAIQEAQEVVQEMVQSIMAEMEMEMAGGGGFGGFLGNILGAVLVQTLFSFIEDTMKDPDGEDYDGSIGIDGFDVIIT